ncbi:MAG TPA: glycosyltransferase [Actinomycetales bacterium]|nr:glycosyltransferase [Actinomycetales bacterium]
MREAAFENRQPQPLEVVDRAKRPRILHVCTRYLKGGSERRIRDIVSALPEFEHELLVGADSDVELARQQSGASRVAVLEPLSREVSPAKDGKAAASLWRLLRRGRYAVIVTHQSKAGVLVRLVAPPRAPVVQSLSMASFGPGYPRSQSVLFHVIERLLARRAAGVCAVGADLASRYVGIGVPAARMHVVRSGVPLPPEPIHRETARRRLRDRCGVADGRPLLAYVGSLERRKNVLSLPDILATLVSRVDSRPFLLVLGDGPDRAALADGIAARGLSEDAALLGHVANPADVLEAIRAADVLLLLSSAEGLPQVLVQGAATGTPFVAYDVDGVRELIGLGAAGEAVPLGDTGAAARAAERLLLTDAGREAVADLSSWSQQSIRAAYRSLISSLLPRLVVAGEAPHGGSA